jgi:hypothetical protein
MILRRIFESRGAGFYVDVGAHHPRRYSNTNYFYKRGWKGINIEPNPDALRIFDDAIAASRLATSPYKLVKIIEVRVKRLSEILHEFLPAGQKIDFLSIDVEGLDLAVLQSNDWKRFRPECVLVEALGASLERVNDSEVFLFMQGHGYELQSKTFNTMVFRDRESPSG